MFSDICSTFRWHNVFVILIYQNLGTFFLIGDCFFCGKSIIHRNLLNTLPLPIAIIIHFLIFINFITRSILKGAGVSIGCFFGILELLICIWPSLLASISFYFLRIDFCINIALFSCHIVTFLFLFFWKLLIVELFVNDIIHKNLLPQILSLHQLLFSRQKIGAGRINIRNCLGNPFNWVLLPLFLLSFCMNAPIPAHSLAICVC